MKINQYFTDPVANGLFKAIQEKNILKWLSLEDAHTLDVEYTLGHSGEKIVSPLVDRLKDMEDSHLIESSINYIANIILTRYADKWTRLYSALIDTEYNPINNYNMSETETPDFEFKDVNKQQTKLETFNDLNNEQGIYGFNSSSNQPSNSNVTTSKTVVIGDPNSNVSENTRTEKGSRTLIRSGNIGVTTSQQMLESEIELRKFNLYQLMYDDVDSIIALQIY